MRGKKPNAHLSPQKQTGRRRSSGHNVRRPLLPTVLVRISAVEGRSKLSLLVLTQPLRTARKIAFVPLPNCQPVRRTIEKSGLPAQEKRHRTEACGWVPLHQSLLVGRLLTTAIFVTDSLRHRSNPAHLVSDRIFFAWAHRYRFFGKSFIRLIAAETDCNQRHGPSQPKQTQTNEADI